MINNDCTHESAIDKINSLVGAEEFKALASEIAVIAPLVRKYETFEVFNFQSYLFSINDGFGLTTYLELLCGVLEENGLFKCDSARRCVEIKLPAPENEKGDFFEGEALSRIRRVYGRDGGAMVSVDISEWMNRLDDKCFRGFLAKLEDLTAENIFVFRVPFVEEDILESINAALNDILYVRPVTIPPLSAEELTECGRRFLAGSGFIADDKAWEVFNRRIIEEKSDGRFYGMNTVNKVVKEMIYRKHLSDALAGKSSNNITENDICGLTKACDGDFEDNLTTLDDLVGMEEVRKGIEEIMARIELSMTNKELGSPCLHMRFVGSPGTGKTTVARLLGRMLKERGVLRNGSFFEYSGRDFCGRYVGETAPKTAGMCRDAYGSVLFIDEAYSLYRGDDERKDFGREALDTLISEMENHRNDLVVIMAGYTDEMDKLMSGNLGLESRMPYIIEFPNYTREQLAQIYMKMAERIKCSPDLEETVKAYFNSLPQEVIGSKSFSNARFVRNLFERTCAKAGIRCKLNKDKELVLTKEDFRQASSERVFDKLVAKKPKARMGF